MLLNYVYKPLGFLHVASKGGDRTASRVLVFSLLIQLLFGTRLNCMGLITSGVAAGPPTLCDPGANCGQSL